MFRTGSFSVVVAVICGVYDPLRLGCQPVFPILHLSEYEPLYQGAPALPPPPYGGWGQVPAPDPPTVFLPDPLTVPASVPVKTPSPPPRRRELALNERRGVTPSWGRVSKIDRAGSRRPAEQPPLLGYPQHPLEVCDFLPTKRKRFRPLHESVDGGGSGIPNGGTVDAAATRPAQRFPPEGTSREFPARLFPADSIGHHRPR